MGLGLNQSIPYRSKVVMDDPSYTLQILFFKYIVYVVGLAYIRIQY